MALVLQVFEAVRAAEDGSDVGGNTVMLPAGVTPSNAGPDLWSSSFWAMWMNSPLKLRI